MIRRIWRSVTGLFASAGLAVGLLVFVGVWSLLATLVAQGEAASYPVRSWAAANPLLEPLVRVLGLHGAFTSPPFLASVALLAVSTTVCAWRRTKVALSRSRALGSALRADRSAVAESHDLEVMCASALSESEVLSIASEAFGRLGLRTRRQGDLLAAVSSPWAVWGSTLFHWSLVALIIVILIGQMLRSEGTMALAVSEAKSDQAGSYISVTAGPWHDWSRTQRSIRLEALEPDYRLDGIDRGPVPTVSVMNGEGKVVVTQRVYANNMLHSGSLAINQPGVGLSVWLASVDASGTETARYIEYVDFSQAATDGTVPLRVLTRKDATGKVAMRMLVTVPLDRSGTGFREGIPETRTAHFLVTAADGETLVDRVVRSSVDVALPGGGAIRLLGVGWYSRLSLVDDPTIPLVYAAMLAAMLGLTATLIFRQQIVVATRVEGPEGPKLLVRLRLWRNVPTSRGEIESALVRALGTDEKESPS